MLSVRDLKRQIYSLHYELLLMSKDKNKLIEYEKKNYTEKEVETKILDDLQKFLLELGQGFSFVARQKRFTIDNDHFYMDLLF